MAVRSLCSRFYSYSGRSYHWRKVLNQRHFVRHRGRVVLQVCNLVQSDVQAWYVELLCDRLVGRRFGLVQAAESQINESNLKPVNALARREPVPFQRFRQSLFPLAESGVLYGKVSMWNRITRIGLRPELVNLDGLLRIPRHIVVVV